MNPLDTGEVFEFEGLNPNPSFSKTKEAPIFRVSFEVTQEQWQDFVNANTSGMIVEAQMKVTEQHAIIKKPKGGKISKQAGIICKETEFQEYAKYVFDTIEPDVDHLAAEVTARNLIYRVCNIESRSELDHNLTSKTEFMGLMQKFNRWSNK